MYDPVEPLHYQLVMQTAYRRQTQYVLWGAVGAFGCMGVLSYSILDRMFPTSVVGRANSALNVLHLAAAWAVQAGMGAVIARWAAGPDGHYPAVTYHTAFALPL